MSDTENTLPIIVNQETGETVRVINADDLLRAASLELHVAEKEDLALFMDNCRHLEAVGKEAREIAGAEVVRRLDRDGSWTWRGGGFELTSASPAAGTTAYDTDDLLAALEQLVADDVISTVAKDKALEPQHGTVTIDRGTLELFAAALQRRGGPVTAREAAQRLARLLEAVPATTYKQKPAGINALLKLGGDVAAAVESAKVTVEPPPRKATVKRVRAA